MFCQFYVYFCSLTIFRSILFWDCFNILFIGLLRNRENGGRAGFEKREKRRKIRQLQSAISDGDVSRVREILSSNFDVDFQYNSQTSLQLAVCEGKEEICALLIAKVSLRRNVWCWELYGTVVQSKFSYILTFNNFYK